VGFGRDLLHSDEELLAELRPHPVLVAGPLLVCAIAVAGAVAIAIHYPGAPRAVAWLLAAMVVLPALWALGRVLRWRSVRLLVTTSRILYRRGVLGRDVVQLRLQRVAEVQCSQTLFGRIIGCGRLVFEVAGGDGPLVIEDVRRPRSLQRVITAQLDRLDLHVGTTASRRPDAMWHGPEPWDTHAPPGRPARRGRTGRIFSDTPPHGMVLDAGGSETASVPGQILQLDELRRRGILSDAEFAAKKAELLGRL
jgi:membrane protein YdbS with pleckstrin-like domain